MNIVGSNQWRQCTYYNGTIQIMGSNNQLALKQSTCILNIMGAGNVVYVNSSKIQLTIFGSDNYINCKSSEISVSFNGSGNIIKIIDNMHRDRVNVLINNGQNNKVLNIQQKQKQEVIPQIQTQIRNVPVTLVRNNRSVSNPERQISRVILDQQRQKQLEKERERIRKENLMQRQNYWRQRLEVNQAFGASRSNRPFLQSQQSQEDIIPPPPSNWGQKKAKKELLTRQQIDKLPTCESKGNKNCSICLQTILKNQQEMFLLCFHSFHTNCCTDWLRKSPLCPNCNLNIKEQLNRQI